MTKLQRVLSAILLPLCVVLLTWQVCLLVTERHTRYIIVEPGKVRVVRVGKHATSQQVVDAVAREVQP